MIVSSLAQRSLGNWDHFITCRLLGPLSHGGVDLIPRWSRARISRRFRFGCGGNLWGHWQRIGHGLTQNHAHPFVTSREEPFELSASRHQRFDFQGILHSEGTASDACTRAIDGLAGSNLGDATWRLLPFDRPFDRLRTGSGQAQDRLLPAASRNDTDDRSRSLDCRQNLRHPRSSASCCGSSMTHPPTTGVSGAGLPLLFLRRPSLRMCCFAGCALLRFLFVDFRLLRCDSLVSGAGEKPTTPGLIRLPRLWAPHLRRMH